jgi:hypothetical protein
MLMSHFGENLLFLGVDVPSLYFSLQCDTTRDKTQEVDLRPEMPGALLYFSEDTPDLRHRASHPAVTSNRYPPPLLPCTTHASSSPRAPFPPRQPARGIGFDRSRGHAADW